MFKLIIFDLDGVLCISNDAHLEVCIRALEKAGFKAKINPSDVTYFFGLPYREVLKGVMGEEYTPDKLEEAYSEQQRLLYSDGFFDNVKRIDGVVELLQDLKKKGIMLAVASGNDRVFLRKALNFLCLDDVFDLVLSADDVKNSKPDPEMVYRAMDEFGVNADEILFVGDARNDVLAAKNAGVSCAVVLTGVLDRGSAKEFEPDFILESVLDVESLVLV